MSRWTKPLAVRLNKTYCDQFTLVNSRISGNCLCLVAGSSMKHFYGEMAEKRLQRDVLSLSEVKTVILAFGINDISYMTEKNALSCTLNRLMDSETHMIHILHEKGIRVIDVTLGPRKGFLNWSAQQESMRHQFNTWLRHNKDPDGLCDPEPLLLENGTADEYAEALHQGDHLHPNTVGGQVIADCFDLNTMI